jgi:spore germination cell wall hydrolase CwlJ-like protein
MEIGGILATALTCLALNVYHEARGEPFLGQVAVAQVTINRVESPLYPDTVCDVVLQPHQFSWTGDGRSDRPLDQRAWKEALSVADMVLNYGLRVAEVEDDALHYHAAGVDPSWSAELAALTRIGNHRFYRR